MSPTSQQAWTAKQGSLFSKDDAVENAPYLADQLITYIGNKRRLLPLVEQALQISRKCLRSEFITFADVFAGTGVVSRMARRWSSKLFINDFEEYSSFSNQVYQTNFSDLPVTEVERWRKRVNMVAEQSPRKGFVTSLYAPKDEYNITLEDRVFYTRRNAMFIDAARAEIDQAPIEVRPFLLAPLIQRASVHVNTSGVFKGFYKNKDGVGQFGGTMKNALQRILAPIEIPLPVLSSFERQVQVSQMEAHTFVKKLPAVDVAYFDPPYNQHPYGSNYFMLNLILRNEWPTDISRVSGIPKHWQRSPYNVRSEALPALESLLDGCPAKVLLVSYNSEGFIRPTEMTTMLNRFGEVEIFDQMYNTFRGCRNLGDRASHVVETLFKVAR